MDKLHPTAAARLGWSGGRMAGPTRLDPFHRDLIRFVLSWTSYGGPPEEELLPRFGVTNALLRQRILAMTRSEMTCDLNSNEREMISRVLLVLPPASKAERNQRRR
jgi:hypothetical protein